MPKRKAKIENNEATLRRFFGDLPVVDADENLRVIINDDDIQKAVRKDVRRCVIAQACRRLFGATTVLIFRSIAYVDLPDENGKRTVQRFTVDPTCRRRLEAWDKTGTPFTGGYLLRAPRASARLNARRDKYQHKDYVKKRRNKAYVKGHAIEIAAADHELRSVGSGLVQMLKTGKAVA